MNGIHRQFCCYGCAAALLLSAISAKADPIATGDERNPFAIEVFIPIILAILIEAICILLILRRSRRPAFFILWLMAMHALTYPLFLGLLWLFYGLHPAAAVSIGEGSIVLIEGGLIYLICRFLSSQKSPLPMPTISRSLFASLIGNICSAVAFPLLTMLLGFIANSIGISD
ncbi:MAG TPA: hypothetical protein VHG71_13440 [Verrucomicrobiae bacterium]|nr:hypothetical protein [Verrucomicrobiae bacterium]